MTRRKNKKHYRLLPYFRVWNRLWKRTLLLGFMLAILWAILDNKPAQFIALDKLDWLIAGAAACFLFTIFGIIAQRLNYVNLTPRYLELVTPFHHLKISYKRITKVRSLDIAQTFADKKLPASQRHIIEPYFGWTAVGLELKQFPLSPSLLRLVLSPTLFLPGQTGFCFIVQDWMGLSNEIDSIVGAMSDRQGPRTKQPGLITDLRGEY